MSCCCSPSRGAATGRQEAAAAPSAGPGEAAVISCAEMNGTAESDAAGQVTVIRDAAFNIAAKLRFPVTAERGRR